MSVFFFSRVPSSLVGYQKAAYRVVTQLAKLHGVLISGWELSCLPYHKAFAAFSVSKAGCVFYTFEVRRSRLSKRLALVIRDRRGEEILASVIMHAMLDLLCADIDTSELACKLGVLFDQLSDFARASLVMLPESAHIEARFDALSYRFSVG